MKKKKKFKTRIYIIVPIFPPPIISDWRKLGWRGKLILSFLADCSKKYAKVASSRQLLSLMDLSLDVYIIFLVSGLNSNHWKSCFWAEKIPGKESLGYLCSFCRRMSRLMSLVNSASVQPHSFCQKSFQVPEHFCWPRDVIQELRLHHLLQDGHHFFII